RRKPPEPLRPEKRPDAREVIWPLLQTELAAPLGPTEPESPSPEIRPDETTKPIVLEPPHPTLVTDQAPSKLPPPPPLPPPPRSTLRDELRDGSSAAGLLLGAAGAGSAERSWREPDSDLFSLPIEPPVLPD